MTDDIKPVAWAIFRDGALDWEHDWPFSDEPQSMMDDEESRPLYGGEVIAEIERLRLDAGRYRWLRDPANAYADEWNLFGPYSSPKEIDAAIDAAMKWEK